MTKRHSPDPELSARLAAMRDALTDSLPEPDPRIDVVLGRTPPVSGGSQPPIHAEVGADSEPVVVSLTDSAAPRSRPRWPIAVAAAVLALAGIGLAMSVGGSDPALDVAAGAATPVAAVADEDGVAEASDDDAGPEAETSSAEPLDGPEAGAEWARCVARHLDDFFDSAGTDGWPFDFDRGDLAGDRLVPALEECGEPPTFEGFDFDFESGQFGLGSFFDDFPFDLDELDLGDFDFEGLEGLDLDGLDLEEVCQTEKTDTGGSIRCQWPPCGDDDACLIPGLGELGHAKGAFEFEWNGGEWDWDLGDLFSEKLDA